MSSVEPNLSICSSSSITNVFNIILFEFMDYFNLYSRGGYNSYEHLMISGPALSIS